MHFINAQPMDVTLELRKAAITAAIEEARSLATNSEWDVIKPVAATEYPAELKPKPL